MRGFEKIRERLETAQALFEAIGSLSSWSQALVLLVFIAVALLFRRLTSWREAQALAKARSQVADIPRQLPFFARNSRAVPRRRAMDIARMRPILSLEVDSDCIIRVEPGRVVRVRWCDVCSYRRKPQGSWTFWTARGFLQVDANSLRGFSKDDREALDSLLVLLTADLKTASWWKPLPGLRGRPIPSSAHDEAQG